MFLHRQEKRADNRDLLAITAIGAQSSREGIMEQLDKFDKEL